MKMDEAEKSAEQLPREQIDMQGLIQVVFQVLNYKWPQYARTQKLTKETIMYPQIILEWSIKAFQNTTKGDVSF